MRYGNQRAETAVNFDIERFASVNDVLALIAAFHRRYGERFGAGSQASEAGVRINTVRVSSYVERAKVPLGRIMPPPQRLAVECLGTRDCHFIGVDAPLATRLYDERALEPGSSIDGPAIVTTSATTYLVEPGWNFHAAEQGAAWLTRG
jgi:N-methylhydantoinase A